MPKVLLIDDDEAIVRALRAVLERAGCDVIDAADGLVGQQRFEVHRPDIVVLDILMPVAEGLETIQGIRRLDRAVPIIAMSGGNPYSEMDYLAVAAQFGANVTLRKPFRPAELVALVGRLTGPDRPAR